MTEQEEELADLEARLDDLALAVTQGRPGAAEELRDVRRRYDELKQAALHEADTARRAERAKQRQAAAEAEAEAHQQRKAEQQEIERLRAEGRELADACDEAPAQARAALRAYIANRAALYKVAWREGAVSDDRIRRRLPGYVQAQLGGVVDIGHPAGFYRHGDTVKEAKPLRELFGS
jgi:hypothetical protein